MTSFTPDSLSISDVRRGELAFTAVSDFVDPGVVHLNIPDSMLSSLGTLMVTRMRLDIYSGTSCSLKNVVRHPKLNFV